MRSHVTKFEARTGEAGEVTTTITVVRLPEFMVAVERPLAVDMPEDVKETLLEWLEKTG